MYYYKRKINVELTFCAYNARLNIIYVQVLQDWMKSLCIRQSVAALLNDTTMPKNM